MKIKLLITGLLGIVTATAFAQKGELSNAQDAYNKYSTFKAAGAAIAMPNLVTAKTSIDKAAANDKTSGLAQTFALKGAIYASLAAKDTVTATSAPLFTTAEESVKKAKELDTKGEYKNLIDDANRNLAQAKLTEGVGAFKAKKYDLAYNAFDHYRQIFPEDTNALYYTGLAAANSKNYTAAIENYNKLVTTKYSENPSIYYDLTSVYLANKDTAGALKSITEGIAKYPANGDLRKRQIEIYLQTGRQQEVLTQIQGAISNDPKNKDLYYYAGLTYSQLAEATAKTQTKSKDQAEKDKLQATKADYFDKASGMYKKALEIDPNYFPANLNLGYVLISPAIDTYNAANQLPASKQKEYDAMVAKSGTQFDLAKPYLLKAVELNPKSVDALINLKTYYMGKKDMANANDTQKKIDALK
jgi:hypothetical protein